MLKYNIFFKGNIKCDCHCNGILCLVYYCCGQFSVHWARVQQGWKWWMYDVTCSRLTIVTVMNVKWNWIELLTVRSIFWLHPLFSLLFHHIRLSVIDVSLPFLNQFFTVFQHQIKVVRSMCESIRLDLKQLQVLQNYLNHIILGFMMYKWVVVCMITYWDIWHTKNIVTWQWPYTGVELVTAFIFHLHL
jgi:hypothetical protein